jgi:chromosome segregation ATPase
MNQSHLDSIRLLNEKIDTLETLKLNLGENLAAKENQIASLTEEINELKINAEKWSEMHKDLELKLTEKTNQMNSLEAEFHEKTEQMKTHHENLLDEIRLELTEKNTEKSEYNSQLEHFQSLNSELNQKLSDNLNQIEILKQVEMKLNEEIKIYQSDLEQSRKTVQSFSQERDDFNQRFEELQAAKLQLENDLSNKQEVIWFIFSNSLVIKACEIILTSLIML